MTRTQRVTMLAIAAVIAIAAFAVIRPGGDDSEEPVATREPAQTATPAAAAPSPEQGAEPTKKARPVRPSLPVLTAGKVRELEVKQGETVRFAARSSSDEEIHVHGYDLSKEAPAGKTVRMSFKADITGIFEIEFEHAGEPIAELKVEP